MRKKFNIKNWIAPILMLVASIIVFIIYLSTKGFHIDIFLQILISFIITLLIPVHNIFNKKIQVPMFINLLVTINLILAMLLGSALRFYDLFLTWDKVCHMYFGFEVAFIFSFIAQTLKMDKINVVGLSLIMFAFTLGCAAVWEFGEFFMDSNFGTDFQNIVRSEQLGRLAQSDTMWDLLVAAIGDLIYLSIYLIDRYALKFKIHNFLGFHLNNEDTTTK